MGFKMDSGDGPNGDINITPLIDVVLVLLIIFMVLTPRTIEELSANLPSKTKTQQPKKKDKPDTLVVAAYSNGEVALNLKVMPQGELADELRQRLRAREKKVVFLDAHPDIDYGQVVSVMDMIRDVGADRVGLARLKEEGPPRQDETEAPEQPPSE